MLKGFLKWLNTREGYEVPATVLNFETNLKVLPKTVTFLHYDAKISNYLELRKK